MFRKRERHTVNEYDLAGDYDTILAASAIAGTGKKRLISRLTINHAGHKLEYIVFANNEARFYTDHLPAAINAYNSIDETIRGE